MSNELNSVYPMTLATVSVQDFTFHTSKMDRPIDVDSDHSKAMGKDLLKNGCLQHLVISTDGFIMSGRHRATLIMGFNSAGSWADTMEVYILDDFKVEEKNGLEVVALMDSFNKKAVEGKKDSSMRIIKIKELLKDGYETEEICLAMGISKTQVSNARGIDDSHVQIYDMITATDEKDGCSVDSLKVLSKLVKGDKGMLIDDDLLALKGDTDALKKEIKKRADDKKRDDLRAELGEMNGITLKPDLDQDRLKQVYESTEKFIFGDAGIGMEDLEAENPGVFHLWTKLQYVYQLDETTKQLRQDKLDEAVLSIKKTIASIK